MKRMMVCLLILITLIMSGCTSGKSSVSMHSQSSDDTTMLEIPDEVVNLNYNPYNIKTDTDGEYLYYTKLDGIYRMPLHGGENIKILEVQDNKYVQSVALHGDYVYYVQSGVLHKVQKDGKAFSDIKVDIDLNIRAIRCLNDTLYLQCNDPEKPNGRRYEADIKDDSEHIVLKQWSLEEYNYMRFPSSRGLLYAIKDNPSITGMREIHQIDPHSNASRIIVNDAGEDFIVTDQYLFYMSGKQLCRVNLNGENKEIVYKADDGINSISLCNYDKTSLYCIEFGDKTQLFKIDQETGNAKSFEIWNTPFTDLVNGYLYGMNDSDTVRMKVTDGKWEYAPF